MRKKIALEEGTLAHCILKRGPKREEGSYVLIDETGAMLCVDFSVDGPEAAESIRALVGRYIRVQGYWDRKRLFANSVTDLLITHPLCGERKLRKRNKTGWNHEDAFL